ncbi:MAG: hypothetical protein IIU08_05295, partial [Clostridia bacterium]|nr:hypothetical protein [Clostridia bacterium]
LVMSESEGPREDCSTFRLKNSASYPFQRSAPIKKTQIPAETKSRTPLPLTYAVIFHFSRFYQPLTTNNQPLLIPHSNRISP